jgi:hypothetical protein
MDLLLVILRSLVAWLTGRAPKLQLVLARSHGVEYSGARAVGPRSMEIPLLEGIHWQPPPLATGGCWRRHRSVTTGFRRRRPDTWFPGPEGAKRRKR